MLKIVRKILSDGKIEGILAEDINTKITYPITKGEMGKYVYGNAKISQSGRIYSGENIPGVEKENLVILHHGSRKGLNNRRIVFEGMRQVDFGSGLYLNTNKRKAEEWVCDEKNSVLYTFALNVESLSIYKFSSDILWALFVAYNRGVIRFDSLHPKYASTFKRILNSDVIVGKIADDKMFAAFKAFTTNLLSMKALLYCIKYIDIGTQWVIKNRNVLDDLFCLGYTKSISVSKSQGVDMLNLINEAREKYPTGLFIKHFKEGKYYD